MKKWFCLSALVIALCLTLTAFAAPGDNMLFFQEDESRSSQSISAMAGTAKGLYTMVSTPDDYNTFQLLYYDYETGETSVIFDKLPQPYWSSESEYAEYGNGLDYKDVINKLFVADDTLYALHTSLGQVSKITVENGKAAREAIGKLDPSILMIEQADYSYSKEIWGLMMAEGKLYVSAYNYEDQEKPANLYRCDLEKGSYEVVTATPIMEMVPYKQGKALCIVYDPNRSWDEVAQKPLPRTIQILDLATGKTEPYYSSEAQFAGLQYDPASDSVFFAQGSQVMRLTADKKSGKGGLSSHLRYLFLPWLRPARRPVRLLQL